MAVPHQMLARPAAIEGRPEIRHLRVGNDVPNRQPLTLEEIADDLNGLRRIPRRIRALAANEVTEERDDARALLVDPSGKLPAVLAHDAPSLFATAPPRGLD